MKKTNVFLEIDDKVYNAVVEPHKRSKTFSKLIAALLNGYINDEYVRAYGDEMVDDLRRASVDSLDEALESMHGSLANMGLFTDELQMVNSKGNKYFSKKKDEFESKSVSVDKESTRESSSEGNNKEIQELQEEVSNLEDKLSSVLDQNKQILELLKASTVQLKEASASVPEVKEKVVISEEDDLSFKGSEFSEDSSKVNNVEEDSISDVHEEIIEEVEDIKPSFDMSFLSDAAISF